MAIRYTHDQELPAQGIEAVCRKRLEGWHSTQTCPAPELTALDVASRPEDMNAPGNDLHQLKGNLAGHWSVSVSGNWRLTFLFEGEDTVLVDYQDYH